MEGREYAFRNISDQMVMTRRGVGGWWQQQDAESSRSSALCHCHCPLSIASRGARSHTCCDTYLLLLIIAAFVIKEGVRSLQGTYLVSRLMSVVPVIGRGAAR